MRYDEAIQFLYGLTLFGTKLGLENTLALAGLCGNPQHDLRFIHVAGTNGKGSVCAMLESVYRRAGARVGLFTSPHLVSFTERIQVNRQCISEERVCSLTAELITTLGGARENWPFRPTFFEFITILALKHFREAACDLVVWETGMGGRLDATNIVTPLASVITNVELDHQQWLGTTHQEIAREKAGIIKPGVPVVTAAERPEVIEVIERTAAQLGAPLRRVGAVDRDSVRREYKLSLIGEHQVANAATVLATVDVLQSKLPVGRENLRSGLANTVWPGRLQVVKVGDTTVLLDGAHNPDGASSLVKAVSQFFAGYERTLVLGLFRDKAWDRMCEILVPGCARVVLVPVQSERTAVPEEIARFCKARWPEVHFEIAASAEAGLQAALRDAFVMVTGSLHFIGEVMPYLGIVPSTSSERMLNEWDAGRTSPPDRTKARTDENT